MICNDLLMYVLVLDLSNMHRYDQMRSFMTWRQIIIDILEFTPSM